VESLQLLDQSTARRLLQKDYSLLVSMAPVSHELRPLTGQAPPHLGPGLPELATPWFKLYLYSQTGRGPPTLVLPKGWKIRRLPKALASSSTLLITTWGHEPTEVSSTGALAMLQDALFHSPVVLQAFSDCNDDKAVVKNVSFPVDAADVDPDVNTAIDGIRPEIDIDSSCGYISLVNTATAAAAAVETNSRSSSRSSPEKLELDSSSAQLLQQEVDSVDSPMAGPPAVNRPNSLGIPGGGVSGRISWQVLDVTFGIPLFDADLNSAVTRKIVEKGLVATESLERLVISSKKMTDKLLAFVDSHRDSSPWEDVSEVQLPTRAIFFDGTALGTWTGF